MSNCVRLQENFRWRNEDEKRKFYIVWQESHVNKRSDFIRQKLMSDVIIKDNKFDKKALTMARKEKTELHFNLFHPKNTLVTVFKMAKGSFVLSHGENINMKPIVRVINESEKIFNALPSQQKKIIRDDMINLRKYKDVFYLRKGLMLDKVMSKFKPDSEFTVLDVSHREMTKLEYEKKNKPNEFKDDMK